MTMAVELCKWRQCFMDNQAKPWAMVAVTLLFLLLWRLRRRSMACKKLPPGPKGLPSIGNLHQLRFPTHRHFARWAKKYGALIALRVGSTQMVVISSSKMARHFFKSHDLAFASRPPTMVGKYLGYGFKSISLSPYGEKWRQARRICVHELLTPARIASFSHIRSSEADNMARHIAAHAYTEVDLSEALSTLATNVMWLCIASRRFEHGEAMANQMTFKSFFDRVLALNGTPNVGDFFPCLEFLDLDGAKRRLVDLKKAFDVFADDLIHGHIESNQGRLDGAKDFVDILLQCKQDKDSIKALMLEMAGAGTDTTSATMEWAMSLLLKHPEKLRKLQDEIDENVGREVKVGEEHFPKLKYLQCVLKETMRLYPAVPMAVPHQSVEATSVWGYELPKGCLVVINLWAMGRDRDVWEDPQEFKPERFMAEENMDFMGNNDVRMMPFGAGRRRCPGAAMAVPLAMLGIGTLVQGFDWKVRGQVDMREGSSVTLPRVRPLLAIPTTRVPWLSGSPTH